MNALAACTHTQPRHVAEVCLCVYEGEHYVLNNDDTNIIHQMNLKYKWVELDCDKLIGYTLPRFFYLFIYVLIGFLLKATMV